jgi:ABC-2 type transport system ATP-binding protein
MAVSVCSGRAYGGLVERDLPDAGGTGTDAPAIVTRALTKRFGDSVALDGLDLEVRAGEVFGFLGPNGAGKTTTIRLLLDLARPTSGSATVLGLDPRRDGPVLRRRIGYLPGDVNLPARLTGRAMLADHAAVRGLDLHRPVDELAERLGADLDRPMGDLSLGNRRKVAMIAAFAHRPDLLVLDEPTGGLDPLVQQTFRSLAREAAAEGRTVFLSSHVLDEVQHVADRVAVLRAGRLVAEDRIDVLLSRLNRTCVVRFDPRPGMVPSAEVFHRVPGVTEVHHLHDGEIEISLEGPAGPLLEALAPWSPLDLATHEPDLEDLFLGYYGAEHAPAPTAPARPTDPAVAPAAPAVPDPASVTR